MLQKDLCNKSSFVNIYVYDCHINHIYIYINLLNDVNVTKYCCMYLLMLHVSRHVYNIA